MRLCLPYMDAMFAVKLCSIKFAAKYRAAASNMAEAGGSPTRKDANTASKTVTDTIVGKYKPLVRVYVRAKQRALADTSLFHVMSCRRTHSYDCGVQLD